MKKSVSSLIVMLMLGSLSLMIATPRTSVQMSGMVTSDNGIYLLTDSKTHRTVELRGQEFTRYVGQQITITGKLMSGDPGGKEVVMVTRVGSGATVSSASKLMGMHGSTVATVTGVAAAGTLAGLFYSGVIAKDQPASRP